MIRTSLFLGLLAAVTVAGVGCTQDTKSTQKKTVYYHDRRVQMGSNLPKSYRDGETATNARQSDLDRETMSQTLGAGNTRGGGLSGSGSQ